MELALPPEWTQDLPTDRPLTAQDHLQLPEGPPYFELIAGAIVVHATPSHPHQRVVRNLFLTLDAACPPGIEAFPVPLDWVADDHNVFEPDLWVIEADKIGEQRLYDPPLLVVDVLSRSTRSRDLGIKKDTYERGGVASYWVIDPDGPELVVYELDDRTGRYVEQVVLTGQGRFEAAQPFPVAIEVGALLR